MTIVMRTAYKGVLYASRTEARWAVLFDRAGVHSEYEPDRYSLKTGSYLPDFWLGGKVDAFFEVKHEGFEMGPGHYCDERLLCEDLASLTKKVVYAACGSPRLNRALLRFDPDAIMPQWIPAWDLFSQSHLLDAQSHQFAPKRTPGPESMYRR